MDMLNGDLQMKNDVASKNRGKNTKPEVDDSEAAFHFIAFVPIDGKIWKLDGLERQPQKLCDIKCENWVYQAKPDIEGRMAQYEEGQIEFSVLSLVKEPLSELTSYLAQNVKGIIAVSSRLDALQAERKDFTIDVQSRLTELAIAGPNTDFGLTREMIDQSPWLPSIEESIHIDIPVVLMELRQKLVQAQADLRASIREEQRSISSDQERATSRRFDYGPAVQEIIQLLARKQIIKPLLGQINV